jgi:hypothetical protein
VRRRGVGTCTGTAQPAPAWLRRQPQHGSICAHEHCMMTPLGVQEECPALLLTDCMAAVVSAVCVQVGHPRGAYVQGGAATGPGSRADPCAADRCLGATLPAVVRHVPQLAGALS